MGTRNVSTLTHYGKDPVTLEADASIVYNRATPQANNDKAFKITGDGVVALVAAGNAIDGRIVLAEETDGRSVKVTAHFFGLLPFRYSGALPVAGQAVVGAANGFVAAAAVGSVGARGRIVQVFPTDSIVVVAFPV
jgi:hypothetical protein